MTDARINHLSFQLDGKLRYDRPISNLDRSITFEWLPRFASQGHTCDQHDTECRPANTHACPREHRIRIASTLKYPKARRLYDAGTLCSPVSIDEKVAIESIDNIGWTAIALFQWGLTDTLRQLGQGQFVLRTILRPNPSPLHSLVTRQSDQQSGANSESNPSRPRARAGRTTFPRGDD